MFMIMKANERFSFEKKAKSDPAKSEGASLGSANVEIPASVARGKA